MRCPFAIWRPLPENQTADDIDPRVAILHTAVSSAYSLFGYFNSPGVNLETHFYTRNDGTIEQYLDTEKQADGNRFANDFAVSIENQDNAANPIVPMTLPQLNANIRLFRWLSDVHPKIRRQRCDRWDGSGYGYHTMWGAPSQWTPSLGKTCPGPARIIQFEQIMIPSLIQPIFSEDNDMLAGYDKNPEDVARATVRELCDKHWGYAKMTAADQSWLVGEWAKGGRENMMIKLLDHEKSAKGPGV